MREQQVTPQTVEQLKNMLEDMAGQRNVKVEVSGAIIGAGRSHVGKMICEIKQYSRAKVLECTLNGQVGMPIPVMPKGFRARQEGDAVAFYQANKHSILIRYDTINGEGYRRFTRA